MTTTHFLSCWQPCDCAKWPRDFQITGKRFFHIDTVRLDTEHIAYRLNRMLVNDSEPCIWQIATAYEFCRLVENLHNQITISQ